MGSLVVSCCNEPLWWPNHILGFVQLNAERFNVAHLLRGVISASSSGSVFLSSHVRWFCTLLKVTVFELPLLPLLLLLLGFFFIYFFSTANCKDTIETADVSKTRTTDLRPGHSVSPKRRCVSKWANANSYCCYSTGVSLILYSSRMWCVRCSSLLGFSILAHFSVKMHYVHFARNSQSTFTQVYVCIS